MQDTRILVIADPFCVRAGLVERLRSEAGLGDFALFSGVEPESPLPSVEAARDLALESSSDLLVGVGGGSTIVTTRAVAILLRKGREVRNLLVPTTPVTAMSRSGAAVLDPVRQVRTEHYDPAARAAAVILDSAALETAPNELFRNAAAAAFCSAIELLTVPALHPLAFADATASATILSSALTDFVGRPDDGDLRLLMASAAFLSGRAADSMPGVSPGIILALAHQLQVLHRIDQGRAMSSLMVAGLRYNLVALEDLEARIQGALGANGAVARGSGPDLVRDVLARAGMPVRLRDLSIERAQLRAIAENSMTGFFATHASRPPTRPEDLLEVLEAAW